MIDKKVDRKKISNGKSGFLTVLVKRLLYGEIWWARFRLLSVWTGMNVLAAAMAIGFEGISLLQVWHNLTYPSILLLAVFVTGFKLVRDRLETEESESEAFVLVFIFLVFITSFTWVEYAYLVISELPGPYVGHYLLAPLTVFIGAVLAGSKYIQDVYNIDDYSLALLYLVSSLFGIAYPQLMITDNHQQINFGKVNRLDLIGGPGYITISPSNAVLIHEQPDFSRVYSGNTFFVPRFGKIVSVVNLEDQRGAIDEVTANTQEGIKITVRNIELRYRIWSDPQIVHHVPVKRSHANPYPYTPQAVRDSVFNRSVTSKGLTPWFDAVKMVVTGKIMDYISSHQFDQIVTPDFQKGDPRKQIHDQLFTPETESRLKDLGARLLWCDIGHFEEDRAALEQRLETWSAKWIGSANVIRAQGEAQRVAYQELGRSEAQADMLKSIIHAFDDVDLSQENKDQNIRNVILMRTAQVLESLIDIKGSSLPSKAPSTSSLTGDTTTKEEK